ncbi:MAG: hypothetical protein COA79_16290 [Planctomycetota bacterium]|nr:MAG: hypothetical protein COA79_16290 [Planctomycetota bacterium]
MNEIPEDFHWDAIVLKLQCEMEHLTKELLPLSVSQMDGLVDDLKLFPAVVKKNITYYQRLEFEKIIEHLPIKILWMPTTENLMAHFFNACKILNLKTSIFKIGKEKGIKGNEILEEIKRYSNLYEIFDQTEINDNPPHIHGFLKSIEEQEVLSEKEIETLISTIRHTIQSLLNKTIEESIQLQVCGIQFVDIDGSVPLSKDDVVNLTSSSNITEDFHLILPDELIRIFYCKLIDSTFQETKIRLNPEIYLQEIFRMSEFFYMTINNWCLLEKNDIPFVLNYDTSLSHISDRANKLSVENKASGAGFLIQWRFTMDQIPNQKISTFFTLELLENLLKTPMKTP